VTLRLVVPGERAMERLGECLAAGIAAEDRALLALEGDLGAGKTRLVRGLAAGLGVERDAVSSPTFVLSMEHRLDGYRRLAHLDAWRMRDEGDLDSVGFDELVATPGTITAVEWASRLGPRLPAERIEISIEHVDESTREVTIDDRRRDAEARDRLARALSLWTPEAAAAPAGGPSDVKCPACGRQADPAAETFPFCTPRCRLIDLGRWMKGEYRLGRPLDPESDEDSSVG
jgi:tRNA threonylcarbamoyladenosine biosynthesis protein TsaE